MKVSDCEAIFFDFDGVLVDSVDVKSEAFAALYESHGEDIVHKVVDYHKTHGGLSRYKKIEHFQREFLGVPAKDDEIDRLADTFATLVKTRVIAADPIVGANEALATLKAICPMFVVSGTPEEELQEIVAERNMSGFFASVHGSPQTKTDIVASLLSRHDFKPEKCLVVGDSPEDHAAAVAHDVKFVGIVPSGTKSLFPPETRVMPDLTGLPEFELHS